MNWKEIEEKWQKRWFESKIFESNPDPSRPKFFITVAYPYPNMPQHIGHARTYSLADAYARYKRMRGYNVLFPMGFHYTGTPILAQSKRIQANDKELIEQFKSLGVDEETIKTFVLPLNIAKYFHRDLKLGMQEMGYSIDWRREFTTIDPPYNKFIEWQFYKLKEKGYITRGSHPVGWCPSCKNPVGQHDTKGDLEPEIGEFTAIKFIFNDAYLPTATLRPETIFGVTNIWINPKAEYLEVLLNNEKMIISEKAFEKLKYQFTKLEFIKRIKGSDLIGKYAINPVNGNKVPILPADFVDPDNATGIVMSVPAHAPYDMLAILDLKKDPKGISSEILSSINPIPIIETPNMSTIPTMEIIEKFGIKNQLDSKAEEATKELYMKEFHFGKMLSNTGKYSGMPVSKARDEVKKDLIESNKAFKLYEIINGPIYCRCGSKIIVNILSDQWFINYGDPEWKKITKEHLSNMNIIPNELKKEFENVIDWLKEKACARRAGLGTLLPWDKEWIIESLSDSTIYMAYYTIARIINEEKIDPSLLIPQVFDYVFLGKELTSCVGIKKEILEAMRREFLYYYPLDSRHSGRDLVPNHLTFFIFNHVAIFPKELWPKQIVVNGSVLMEGKKMSKSLGNIIPLRKAIRDYGADVIRVSVLSTSELLQDADFSPSLAENIKSRLEEFYEFALKYADAPQLNKEALDDIDKWILSRTQRIIEQVTISMEALRVREVIQNILYIFPQEINWYIKRKNNNPNESVMKYIMEILIKLLAPFTPHLCEELWEKYGNNNFISIEKWPEIDKSLIDIKLEASEEYLRNVINDTSEIIKITEIKPSKIYYCVAPKWKWDIYLKVIQLIEEGIDPKLIIREIMKDKEIRTKGEAIVKFINSILSLIISMPKDYRRRILNIGIINEAEILKTDFISRYFNAQVYVGEAFEEVPKKKIEQAIPMRPAIYIV
ncbi:MAG: leucine--tRNA ligase [Candidatus Verstraetearchaeota archaeon]|nr:leucine--tRNA ligase [Candidatus Verstraetearchaeota archaeon]